MPEVSSQRISLRRSWAGAKDAHDGLRTYPFMECGAFLKPSRSLMREESFDGFWRCEQALLQREQYYFSLAKVGG